MPNDKYVYLPVPTESTIAIANNLNEGRAEKGKDEYTLLMCSDSGFLKFLRRKIGSQVLSTPTPGDIVYIVAHGYQPPGSGAALKVGSERGETNVGNAFIPKFEGGTSKTYTASELADHLKTEGLKDGVCLRVFACGSGLIGPSATDCYAKQLADGLKALGYGKQSMWIEGYLGNLSGNYGIKVATKQGATETYTKDEHKGVYINDETLPRVASQHKIRFYC